jgi:homoserine O-succinyltransferase/O-acetyltransferase
MPVVMEPGSSGRSYAVLPGVHCAPRAASMRRDGIEIGIVNNMPDQALEATERQFIGLLATAAERTSIRVRLFALSGVPRSEAAQRYIASHYADIGELWSGELDGLIVTGTEPRAPLAEEPYWPAFTRLVDWAGQNTASTIWSCLAAHAAVFHLDGVDRQPFAEKCFGVFQCERLAHHRLTASSPRIIEVPHSRWNDAPERALTACGYGVLARSAEIGADMFVKEMGGLFVFLQGHPEYDASTLLREFRRDVARYLRGERNGYPAPPKRYFDRSTVQSLDAFRERALSNPDERLMEGFPATSLREPLVNAWRASAIRFYRNWLALIAERRRSGARFVLSAPPAKLEA